MQYLTKINKKEALGTVERNYRHLSIVMERVIVNKQQQIWSQKYVLNFTSTAIKLNIKPLTLNLQH